MAKDLAKQYDPAEVEDRTYKFWCDKNTSTQSVSRAKKLTQ